MTTLPDWSHDNPKMAKTFFVGPWPRKLKRYLGHSLVENH